MILDTNFLIDLLKGEDEMVRNIAEELDKKFSIKGIASISVMELWRGAAQSIKKDEEKRKVNDLLDSLVIYNFSEHEAKKSGEIESNLVSEGKMIDIEDVMIAGTALTKGEKIITRNVKHFENIPSLKVQSY